MQDLANALQDLKNRMLRENAEWPDITWQVCQRWKVRYEDLADAYDEDQRQRDN